MRKRLQLAALVGFAARNIARNKTRSTLSLAAIAVGVVGLILSGGFVNDLIYQLGEAFIHSQSGHLQIARPAYFDSGARTPGKHLIDGNDAEASAIATLPEVKAVMRRIGFSALLSNGRASYAVIGEGIEPAPEALLGTSLRILQGRSLSEQGRFEAVVGAGLAQAMGLSPGSGITLVSPTVDESMNSIDLEVVGVFQSFSRDYDERAIKLPLDAARELLDTKGVSVLVVLLKQSQDTASVAGVLAQWANRHGLEVKAWPELNDFYWKAVALYDRQFGVLRAIVLLMVLLAVAGAINVAVLERTAEFGTMRALGNLSRDVRRLVLIEGALLGVLGAVLGATIGVACAWVISAIGIPMPPPPNSNVEFTASIRLDTWIVASAFLVGALATLVASIAPALRVSRLPIGEALRRR